MPSLFPLPFLSPFFRSLSFQKCCPYTHRLRCFPSLSLLSLLWSAAASFPREAPPSKLASDLNVFIPNDIFQFSSYLIAQQIWHCWQLLSSWTLSSVDFLETTVCRFSSYHWLLPLSPLWLQFILLWPLNLGLPSCSVLGSLLDQSGSAHSHLLLQLWSRFCWFLDL